MRRYLLIKFFLCHDRRLECNEHRLAKYLLHSCSHLTEIANCYIILYYNKKKSFPNQTQYISLSKKGGFKTHKPISLFGKKEDLQLSQETLELLFQRQTSGKNLHYHLEAHLTCTPFGCGVNLNYFLGRLVRLRLSCFFFIYIFSTMGNIAY